MATIKKENVDNSICVKVKRNLERVPSHGVPVNMYREEVVYGEAISVRYQLSTHREQSLKRDL